MSSDGKVIVYEENFGIWKLDVATGKSTEITPRPRERRKREPGRHRGGQQRDRFLRHLAVRPAGGDLGTRPDADHRDRARRHHAGRTRRHGVAQSVPEVVAGRQVHRLLSPTAPAATRSGSAIRTAAPEEGHRPGQREGRDRRGRRTRRRCSTRPPTGSCISYSVADGKTAAVSSSDVDADRLGVGVARQQVGRLLEAGPHAAVARLHRADRAAARSGTSPTTACSIPRATRCGPPTGGTWCSPSAEGFSNGIASQGGINTTMALWALSLRDQDRDPSNRDIDNEAQGLAAEAAARQTRRARRRGAPPPPSCIDWTGMARRARQLTVPGTAIGQSHGRARRVMRSP